MKKSKRLLSIILSICMLFSIAAGAGFSADAATSTRDKVITSNVTKIKKYIKNNGFINGNGEYTIQNYIYGDNYIDYYLMYIDSYTNARVFQLNTTDNSTDELVSTIKLDLSSPTESVKLALAYYYNGESEYSTIGGYAYLSQNYYDELNNAAFYIEYNDTYMSDSDAAELFSILNQLAFDGWNQMLKSKMGMNLGSVGFVKYCTGHKWNSGEVTKKATTKATGIKTYTCTLCGATKTSKIAKNNYSVKGLKTTVKYATVKKKNVVVKRAKAITVKNAKGKVTYKKTKGNKKITVAKNGNITVKKGIAKGTYKIKVKVTAAGNTNYNKETKTVTVTITVK